jgi:hypothetical protein
MASASEKEQCHKEQTQKERDKTAILLWQRDAETAKERSEISNRTFALSLGSSSEGTNPHTIGNPDHLFQQKIFKTLELAY